MSRVCAVTGKHPLSGNNRSHSLRATRRVQRPNLHTFKINVDGKEIKVKMSTRGYRILKKKALKAAPKATAETKPATENKTTETAAK